MLRKLNILDFNDTLGLRPLSLLKLEDYKNV